MPQRTVLSDLTAAVARPTSPLVTYYDVATGERVELSAVTCANWVAQTANFLVDELDAGPGTRVRIGLPTHWLRAVWLLSAWQVGAVVTDHEADIAVVGPDLDADEPQRVASALLPFGVRFPQAPEGFVDLGVEIPAQPDIFVAFDPPSADDLAVDLPSLRATHAELAAIAPDERRLVVPGGDVVRDATLLTAACLGSGSLVLVRDSSAESEDPDALARIAVQEHATVWSPER